MSEKNKQEQVRQMAALYPRLIEWSAEDRAFVGSSPPLIGPSCHGDSGAEVAAQLDEIIMDLCEDAIDGKIAITKPPQQIYSGKFVVRIEPGLHKMAAIRAMANQESLNDFVAQAIASATAPVVPSASGNRNIVLEGTGTWNTQKEAAAAARDLARGQDVMVIRGVNGGWKVQPANPETGRKVARNA